MSQVNANSQTIQNIQNETLPKIAEDSVQNSIQNSELKKENQKESQIQTPFWADSYCITKWNKPESELLIWKKLNLEESLENLQIVGDFILDKKLWLKMYLEMINKINQKLIESIDLTTQNSKQNSNLKKENFDNSGEKNNLQNKLINKENKIKILEQILQKLLDLEDFEVNWHKTLAIEIKNLDYKNSKNLEKGLKEENLTENNKLIGKNQEEIDHQNTKLFSKLHEFVLLEFWKTANLEFWAIICGEFWQREIKNYLAENNKKVGDYLWPLRVGLSGQKQSPSPFEILACLDYEQTKKRIETCTNLIQKS